MRKILVVDDFSPNLPLLSKILDKCGYLYEFASNGITAIEKLKKKTYDLVMMDIQKPVMENIETLEFIRKNLNNENKNVIIIAITGHDDLKYLNYLYSCGFNYVVEKPFHGEELSAFLENLFKAMDLGPHITKSTIHKPEWLDSEYLECYAQGDEQFICEIILLFENTITELISNIKKGIESSDWVLLRMSVHKMVSQLTFMGINQWKGILNEAESNYKNMIEYPKIDLYLQDIEKDCIMAIEYLKFKYKIT